MFGAPVKLLHMFETDVRQRYSCTRKSHIGLQIVMVSSLKICVSYLPPRYVRNTSKLDVKHTKC